MRRCGAHQSIGTPRRTPLEAAGRRITVPMITKNEERAVGKVIADIQRGHHER
jgi:hypothetical protein